ncbi:succinate dehydrogenase cytochrome b558 subunit [Bacillus taeanensis]|uniref:Succinate dehydrogenase n=1 Tax=Bacillus taeanensis TaxID=273032 RepID=A0A366XY06_9BACI|nr:succinate dehydrogenase cytochrome b558 subunit [Bacillus taeanensis]RBW69034.1 succinate dehydrogenase [Bacillus taeanensis]
MAASRDYVSRKLHSLLGVIPLGVFLIQHLVVNHFATKGEEAFNTAAHFMETLPFRYVLETLVIFLPLLFHGIYGVYISFQAKNNVSRYGYFRNLMFLLQRITGIVALIFITWHVWQTRVQAQFGADVNYNMMADILASPVAVVLYLIGVISVIFHFSNGLWSFFVSWGLTVTPRSQKLFSYVTMVIFIALSIVGIRSIFAFI